MFILYGNDVKHMVSVAYLSLCRNQYVFSRTLTHLLPIVILDNGIRFQDKAAAKEIKQ